MLEKTKTRNQRYLIQLCRKYNIEKSFQELTVNYESVFVSIEYMEKDNPNSELKRAILYGNLKFEKINDNWEKTNKKEILYNFGKKAMKGLSEKNIEFIILELRLIGMIVKQSKLIMKLELEESDISTLLGEIEDNYQHSIKN